MSFLSEIKNFITTDLLGIKSSDTQKSADKKTKVNTPVIQCKNVEENVDSVKISQQTQPQNPQKPKNLGQIKESIQLKCKANGISIKSMSRLFAKVAGINQEQYEALSEAEKIRVLEAVDFTVDRLIEYKKEYGLSKQANTEEIISMRAQNSLQAVKKGRAKSVKEFENEVGDVNDELGKEFRKADIKTRRARMEKMAKARRNEFEATLQEELKNIPEGKRAEYEAKRREDFNRIERARFSDILAVHDTETANHAIVMLPANDMAYGAKAVIASRCSHAESTRAADMQTFDFFKSNLRAYHERGEEVDTSVIEEFNEASMSAKSAQAAHEYQDDYKEARIRFESGEDVPPYMSKEVFTATAKGIGSGALNNVNMTTEEKAEFLAAWENDAKSFSDYEVVTKAVKEEIAKNPEFAEKFEKAKQNILKNKEAQKESKNKENNTKVEVKTTSPVTNPQKVSALSPVNRETSVLPKKQLTQEESVKVKELKQTNNVKPQEIAATIQKTSSLDEAFKQYSQEDVIKAVLETPHLKHLRPQIADRLSNMDVVELEQYVNSTETFLFILRNISPQKAAELYDNKKGIGYDAKVLGEQILEKGNNYQNAIA